LESIKEQYRFLLARLGWLRVRVVLVVLAAQEDKAGLRVAQDLLVLRALQVMVDQLT